MFWKKYCDLCEKNNIRPRKFASELGMSPAGVTRWVHGSVPNRETLEKIAAKFGVTTDYLISDEEFFITSAEKRSTFKKLTALPQRWNSLHAGFNISKKMLVEITDFVNCSIYYLNSEKNVEYIPEGEYDEESFDDETLFTVLDIMDACADTDAFRIIQIQLSRIVLYHLNENGYDREKVSAMPFLSTPKLDFLYTGKENKDVTFNYGLNYSDLSSIRHETGLSYWVLFTGNE